MRSHYLMAVVAAVALVAACGESPLARSLAPSSSPLRHVGYKGPDEPYGFVTNDAECHVGKRGARWDPSEWYDVKVYDAHLVLTPSGEIEMVCRGEIPKGQPIPASAEWSRASSASFRTRSRRAMRKRSSRHQATSFLPVTTIRMGAEPSNRDSMTGGRERRPTTSV